MPPASPAPRRIRARYEANCRHCGRFIARGERIVWSPATRRVLCDACSLVVGPP